MKFIKSFVLGTIANFGVLTTGCQIQQSQDLITRTPKEYIGFQYPVDQQPQGLEYLGGSNFGGGAVRNMQGGYAYVRQGQQNMLWLIGQRKQGSQGKPVWEILDVLSFPKYDQQLNNRTYSLAWGGKCRTNNGLSNVEVAAIVVLENQEWLDKIKQAWKINRKTGKFESLPTNNIVCENPHLG
ncbi:hypothetical protein CEN39_02260 [Fischerella thermalis CCMEE 5201]|jgi:hypothetical protein|nr:hypothetical protein CEN39_02260 [Fischerella thermalis CCMEE 5201]